MLKKNRFVALRSEGIGRLRLKGRSSYKINQLIMILILNAQLTAAQ
jgi:hypothetical protein